MKTENSWTPVYLYAYNDVQTSRSLYTTSTRLQQSRIAAITIRHHNPPLCASLSAYALGMRPREA